ncbi:multiple PDZ domain protein-like isoform X10 [Crassostrea angulata]|uniref:multiple PDZ domain protein-like isoform X10 n=1 Tax=Magallana angulata TaxID=2784310 RepID=UPI0022B10C90|nr:multiple PDZ domain protein-like isoform X10 [Crassostrea angulata]
MSLIDSTEQAVEYVEHLQTRLWDQGDHSMDDDLTSLLAMMESPLFRQILNLQESLQELKQVTQTYPVTEDNFEITYSGQLILNMPPNGVPPNQTLSDNAAAFSSEENLKAIATTPGYDEEFQKTIERVAKGREVETIKLFKPENMSLGFSVVGLKGENNEETGIFVQDIQPGGIAARDGRLREQDQILAIDGQPLDISHQEAIRILQSARGLVVLIIARGYQSPQFEPPQLVNEPVQGSAPNVQAEVQSEMVLNTEWTQIEVIDLENDGSGLGFGIFGGRSSGVIVKTILPGGVACRNGQLHSGDHILQIGDVNVRGMSSEQVAAVLRQSGREVRLIVARPVNEPSAYPTPHAPVVPTHQLDEHLQQINALLHGEQINQHMADELAAGMIQVHMQPGYNDVGADYPEVEYFDVTLMKDSQGLGITIAGYVGKDNTPDDLCGIFVKSVADCSAAAKDGRIQVNDQIIKVDNQPLHGFTNHQAVEVLRNTGQMVHLQLARFQHGPKYEKLQQYLAQPPYNPQQGVVIAPPPPSQMDGSMISPMDGPATIVSPMIEQPTQARMVNHVLQTPPTDPGPGQQVELQDITLNTDEDYSGDLSPDIEEAIKACWEPIVGSEFEVVVAQLSKFREGGGLGISLEGTVDVEKGVEVRPHHYIRFILSDGPVGINGRLKSGDELLEVNGRRLLGLNHKEVVGILKELPQHVRLVCARHKETENYTDQDKIENGYSTYLQSNYSGVNEVSPITERLVKAKSENTLASTDESVLQQMMKNKSRSLEELTNFKMWSIEPVVIELCKGDKGLGFSILDYKDPENLNKTVIVIKSLVPGGVAQVDGRLLPGDRLIFVNDEMLENASLDEAVNALKGAPKGIVRIGVKKALPLGGIEAHQQAELQDSAPPPLPVSLPPALDEQIDHTEEELSIKIINPKRVRNQSKHQKTASVDSQQSSSSDQPITSDLTNSHSPSIVNSTNHITSPSLSPLSSPRLARTLSGGADSLPVSLEKVIKIKKSRDPLGLTVEAVDKGANGCTVKTMTPLGAFSKDGRVQQGDYIVSINNESMRRITSAQARAIIRRASLQGLDVSVSYISKEDAAVYQETAANAPPTPPHPSMMPSPKIFPKYYRANLSPLASPRNTKPDSSPERSPVQKTPETVTPRVKSLTADGSPATGNQTWGPPRTVELEREQGKSLGISIVGGRVDMFNIQTEHIISGIFIKHVLEDSPAGRNGTLKTGDRILEVDGKDLRNAAHDQAVDIIRHAKSPVKFVVQSLCDPACPRDLENDTKSVHSYDEASLAAGQTYQAVDVPLLESVAKLTKDADDSEEEDEFGYTKKKIQRQYGDLNGDLHVVDLNRGHGSLGINLAGNKDRNTMSVFVAGVQPEGIAGKDGRIQVGDELLEVNGQVLYGRSHLNASAIIKSLSTNVIKFVLLRRSDNLEHMAVKPLKMTAAVSHEDVSHSEDQDKNGNLTPLDVIQVVTLEKGASGLGFAIVEEVRDNQPGIFIRSITPGGVAAQDGQLSVGDQILEVGDKPLTGVHYEKAIEILRNMQGTIKLKVRKNSSEKKLSFSTTNHLDPEPGTKSVFQLQSAPGESSTDPNPADEAGEEESADPKTCPIIPGRETTIEIEKGRTGLGLSIVGGADTLLGAIIVHEVYEEGAAARDGRLWAGDQILEVNYEDLKDATHDYAIQVLRQTPSTVQIKVFRDDSQVKEEDIYDIFSVELTKKPGRGLGLSIVGKRNDVGVYISDIVKGGTAEADGRLMQGDQILAVNKEDMRNATQEYAAAVLKTLMGKVSLTVGRLKAGSRASSRKNSTPGSALKKSESSVSNKSKGGKHSKSHSEDLTHIRVVELEHDITGSLGLSIAGGIGSSIGDTAVIIANMTPAGPAAKSQKLKIGDQILSINDVQLDGMSHDEVVQLLKKPGTIKLTVSHGEETRVSVSGHTSRQVSTDMSQEYAELMAQDNVFQETLAPDEGPPPQCKTLHLNKGPEGLGFSIVGGHGSPHGDLPIYVKSVFSKGAAADEGSLKRGDQIISVNGQSLEGCTHDEAVSILKNTRGAVTMTVLTS